MPIGGHNEQTVRLRNCVEIRPAALLCCRSKRGGRPHAAPGIDLAAGNPFFGNSPSYPLLDVAAQASTLAQPKTSQFASATHHQKSGCGANSGEAIKRPAASIIYDDPQRRNRIPSTCYCCTVARDDRVPLAASPPRQTSYRGYPTVADTAKASGTRPARPPKSPFAAGAAWTRRLNMSPTPSAFPLSYEHPMLLPQL